MSRFLTRIWGQSKADEVQQDGEPCSNSKPDQSIIPAPTTGAAPWIAMSDPPAGARGGGEPMMSVNQSTVDTVLTPLGDDGPVNVVAVFGAARGGKSFLMNQLAGQDDIFKISNDKDPCTQGVDVSRAVVPLREFATVDGCVAPRAVSGSTVRVLFADVEGQGDRDVAYDARLASTILPLTKCVIFNWRDSLQVDRMLNLLGVMQRAAHNIDLGDDGEGSAGPKFGHLHVVFRDWNYNGTAEEVKKQLFGLDKGMSADVAVKNELRRTIKGAFTSVTVWLFPAPVEMTSELSKELKKDDLSQGFVSQLATFRYTLSSQLAEPMAFGPANPVTGHALGSLVPALVDVLNRGDVIMPQSAYQQMLAMEAEALKKTYLEKADNLIELGKSACNTGPAIPPADLEADMNEEIQKMLAEFATEAGAIGAKQEVMDEGAAALRSNLERGMEGLRAHNRSALARHLKAAVKEARETFTREFTQAVRAAMPLPQEELAGMASEATSKARALVKSVPKAADDDESVEDALSALGDFVELAASKAERENASLMLEQSKKEDEALEAAVAQFEREVKVDLVGLRGVGGAPYQISLIDNAAEGALAGATAALRNALPANGGSRLPRLVALLQEKAKAKIVEEKSEYRRNCSAAMLKLGTEERRRLRAETEQYVYPLLPLVGDGELEDAFRPVLERVNGRVDEACNGWTLDESEKASNRDAVKSDAESVWQSLVERNERTKLQQEKAAAGADAQRQAQEAAELRHKLEEERRRALEAENTARDEAAKAEKAKRVAIAANQRARQELGAREREAVAREQERQEEAAKRAAERNRTAAEKAALAKAAKDATLAAAAAKKAGEHQAMAAAAAAKAEGRKEAEDKAAIEKRKLGEEKRVAVAAAEASAAAAAAAERRERETKAATDSAAAAAIAAAQARERAAKAAADAASAAALVAAEARDREAKAAAEAATAVAAAQAREREAKAAAEAAEEAAARKAREREAKAAAEAAAAVAAAQAREREAKAAVKAAEEAAARKAREQEAKAAAEAAEAAAAAEAREREAKAAADAAAAEEQQDNLDGFEDAMETEEDDGRGVKEESKPGRRSRRRPREEDAEEEEDEDEPPAKRASRRTSSRRQTIMTPVGKDPEALRKAREDAAKQIKEREDKASKHGAKAQEDEAAGEDEFAGMSEVEKSRMRAKKWAKEQKEKKAKAKKATPAAAAPSPAKRTSSRRK